MLNNNQVVSITKNSNRFVEVDVHAVSDWDGFDKLIAFLKNEYSVIVIEQFDGPDARRWILESEGIKLELLHDDPYGNTIVSVSLASNEKVKEIGNDLKERLSD